MTMRKIEDDKAKEVALSRIISFRDMGGMNTNQWFNGCKAWVIQLPTQWVSLDLEEPIDLALADVWKKNHGPWCHGFDKTEESRHNRLGMAWAQHTENTNSLDEITLLDEPDIRAKSRGKFVCGDIGRCSPGAFHNALMSMMGFHCLWVSVLDRQTQIIIEFLYNPAVYLLGVALTSGLKTPGVPNMHRYEEIKRAFWCPDCQEWSITEESRKYFMEFEDKR